MGRIEVRKVFELDSFPPVPDIQMPDELGDMIVTYKNQPQGTYKRVSLKPYYNKAHDNPQNRNNILRIEIIYWGFPEPEPKPELIEHKSTSLF